MAGQGEVGRGGEPGLQPGRAQPVRRPTEQTGPGAVPVSQRVAGKGAGALCRPGSPSRVQPVCCGVPLRHSSCWSRTSPVSYMCSAFVTH